MRLALKKRKKARLSGGMSDKQILMNRKEGPHKEPRSKTLAKVFKKATFIILFSGIYLTKGHRVNFLALNQLRIKATYWIKVRKFVRISHYFCPCLQGHRFCIEVIKRSLTAMDSA
jgi:hypothetical protein